MIDIKTVMLCLLIVEGLLGVLMLLSLNVQKQYQGYTLWSISLLMLAASNVFFIARGIIPDYMSILLGNLLTIGSLLLMAEALHRFYTGTRLPYGVYGILVLSAIFLIYGIQTENIAIRSLIISGAVISITVLMIQIVRARAPPGHIPSRYLLLSLVAITIIMTARGVEWMLIPAGRSFFEQTALNISLYLGTMIALLSTTFMFLLLNSNRLATELSDSHTKTAELLTELDTENKKLDQKVQERTERIHDLMLQKDQFITQVAHDLRTPLTPLVALVPLLRYEIKDPDTAIMLDILEKNVSYLRSMTEQLVVLANLNCQNSITDTSEKQLAGLIEKAISINAGLIEEQEITIEVAIPESLNVCVSNIFGVTIFSNLINNAIKYNVKSGHITITGAEEDSMVLVSIRDTGIGMSTEVIKRIWDELYVCDMSRTDPLSKGLGLSMVEKIVTLHGGDITASSPGPGSGSEFLVRLPRDCGDICTIPPYPSTSHFSPVPKPPVSD